MKERQHRRDMDIATALDEAKTNRQQLMAQINELQENQRQLEQRKQTLIQEALRLDGEVRALARLSENGDKPAQKTS